MSTKLGRVSSVFVDEELNSIFVNVVVGPGVERRRIPFVTPKASFWLVPEEGDIVEVYEVDREWSARFPHHTPEQTIPEGFGEGDVCLKLDEDTEIRFQKNEQEEYDVTVRASGELRLLDREGYGIISRGDGLFTWFHEHIELTPHEPFEKDEGEES